MKITSSFQGEKHIPGSKIVYTAGIWSVVDQNGNPATCKAVSIVSTGSGGVLKVHPVLSSSANGLTDEYYELDLLTSDRDRGVCIFDKVAESGTTVALSEITLWLQ